MKGIGRQATERYARRFTQRAFIQAQLKFIQLESARLADEAARTRQQQITAAMKARIDYVLITDYGAEWADATRDERIAASNQVRAAMAVETAVCRRDVAFCSVVKLHAVRVVGSRN